MIPQKTPRKEKTNSNPQKDIQVILEDFYNHFISKQF